MSAFASVVTTTSQTIFSNSEFATLRAICDTFIPSIQEEDDPHGFYAASASSLHVPEQIAATVAELPEETRTQLKQLLRALDKPLMNLLFSGKLLRFRILNQLQREAFLWADHLPPDGQLPDGPRPAHFCH